MLVKRLCSFRHCLISYYTRLLKINLAIDTNCKFILDPTKFLKASPRFDSPRAFIKIYPFQKTFSKNQKYRSSPPIPPDFISKDLFYHISISKFLYRVIYQNVYLTFSLFFFFIKISSKVQNSRYPNIKVRSTQFDPRIYPHQFSHSLNRILNTITSVYTSS